MEIRQIEYFLAVVDTGSLSAAAKSLGITQSGVSASLAAMEQDLGASLFLRSPGRRQAVLTEAGAALLPSARKIIEHVVAGHYAVSATKEAMSRGVRVASIDTPRSLGLLDAWADFRADHPELRLTMLNGSTGRVIELVERGEADFGIAAVSPFGEIGLEVHALIASPLGMMMHSKHRLAGHAAIAVNDLMAETLITLAGKYQGRRLFDYWVTRNSSDAKLTMPSIEFESPMAALGQVQTGTGVFYSPMAFAEEVSGLDLKIVPLAGAPMSYLSVISKPGTSSSAVAAALRRAYIDHCARTTSENPFFRRFCVTAGTPSDA